MGRSDQGWARRNSYKRVKQHERKEQRAASKKAELLKALMEAYPENWDSSPKTPPDPEAHRAIADVKSSMKMSRSPTPNREVKFANVLTTETRNDPYRVDEELRFSNPGALVEYEGCDRSVRQTDGLLPVCDVLQGDLHGRHAPPPAAAEKPLGKRPAEVREGCSRKLWKKALDSADAAMLLLESMGLHLPPLY